MLQTQDGPALRQEALNLIDVAIQSCGFLRLVVNDVLDFCKCQAKKMEVEHVAVDPRAVMSQLRALLQGQCVSKNLYLHITIDNNVPQLLLTDPLRLLQILTNLLTNSIKFTDDGGVTIQVQWRPFNKPCDEGSEDKSTSSTDVLPTNGVLTITVADTGIGISTEHQARLFSPFEQSETGTSRKFGGTGLGLSISHNLAQLMGGQLSFVPCDKGSSFTLEVPLVIATKGPLVVSEEHAGSAQKQLVLPRHCWCAEDNTVNQKIVQKIFDQLGVHIEAMFSNGQEMVDVLLEHLTSSLRQLPDLILLDVHMPILDGFQTARLVREKLDGHVFVLGLSADVTSDTERERQTLFDHFLPKPFQIADISHALEVFSQWTRRTGYD